MSLETLFDRNIYNQGELLATAIPTNDLYYQRNLMLGRTITTIAAAGLITLGALSAAGPASAQNTDQNPSSITLETESGSTENLIPATGPTPENSSLNDGEQIEQAEVLGMTQQSEAPAPSQPTSRSLSPRDQELLDSIMTPEEQAQLAKKNQEAGNAVLAVVMGASLALLTVGVMVSRAIRGRKKREEIPS